MNNPVLEVCNLRVTFENDKKETIAVDNVSFNLERGEILGIVGESGSGKSVTSLAIMGLLPETAIVNPQQSNILFRETNEEEIDLTKIFYGKQQSVQAQKCRGGPIAMIFQEPMSSFNPVYTIGSQLIEGILQHYERAFRLKKQESSNISAKVKRNNAKGRAIALLEQVQLPEAPAKMNRYPHELSGGQLQRVMIAMAIACNPTILIADEPTTALDVTVQAEILDLLRGLCRQRQMSMIFITHDFGVVAEMADTVVVMRKGNVVEEKSIREILEDPEKAYTQGLLACRPRLGNTEVKLPTVYAYLRDYIQNIVEEIDHESELTNKTLLQNEIDNLLEEEKERLSLEEPQLWTKISQLLNLKTSHSLAVSLSHQYKPSSTEKNQGNILTVEDLSIRFPQRGIFGNKEGEFVAVNNVSFQIEKGKTLGVVGESGCGKSTLARALLRLLPTAAGKIKFEDQDITHLQGEELRQLRRKMQIIFQNPYSSLNPRMTIGNAVIEPLIIHNKLNNPQGQKQKIKELFENVGLNPDWMSRYPHQLSGGQRQRVCIARALALNPDLIICDESVSALDVSVQAQVLNLLKELQSEYNLTYLFISHDLSVVEFMSDDILVMNKIDQDKLKKYHDLSNVEEEGKPEKILYKPEKAYTKKLIRSIPIDRLTIKIGGIPYRDSEKLDNGYGKLCQYLEETIGTAVKYKPLDSYAEVVRDFSQGNLDLVCLDGVTGVLGRYLVKNAQLIAQANSEEYSVFLANQNFVNENQDIINQINQNTGEGLLNILQHLQSLNSQENSRFIWGDKLSTASYLIPVVLLHNLIINHFEDFDLDKFECFGNDDRNLKLIQAGINYDLGVISGTIWQQYPQLDQNIQVIWRTPAYHNIHWLIYPHIKKRYGEDIANRIQTAFLSLDSNNSEHQEILQLFGVDGFNYTDNDVYLNISQKLQLSKQDITNIFSNNIVQDTHNNLSQIAQLLIKSRG